MKKIKSIPITGYPENAKREAKYRGLGVERIHILDSTVIIQYNSSFSNMFKNTSKYEMFIESFDPLLNHKMPFKKIK